MGVFEVREENMPEPGGKDDLKIGHKIVEELEKDKERDARREQEFLKNYGKH